jgi:hypothetical protein
MTPCELAQASLTDEQRGFLEHFGASGLAGSYYLTGGTALSGFYLFHRVSEDLDFFTPDPGPLSTLESFLRGVSGLVVRSFQRLFDRRIFLLELSGRPLKAEFTRYDNALVESPVTLGSGLRVNALLDIFLDKLAALADRREPKDEVDVFFLLRSGALPPIDVAARLAETKSGLRGLPYILQRRLLAVSQDLPPTTPQVARTQVLAELRQAVEVWVAGGTE